MGGFSIIGGRQKMKKTKVKRTYRTKKKQMNLKDMQRKKLLWKLASLDILIGILSFIL